jgi:hypothetical protein
MSAFWIQPLESVLDAVVTRAWGRHACCAVSLCAGSILSSAPEASFSFVGPEVLKLDWATRSLNVADFNNDGLNDLAVVNNDLAQIELLYQRESAAVVTQAKTRLNRNRWQPQLEDAGFEREGITIGYPVFDLSVGDLNGDGWADIAYTAREVPLTIRYQDEGGHWTQTHEFDDFEALGWGNTLEIADLDGDGRTELVVIAADALRVFRQNAQGQLGEPELYYLTGDNPFNLLLEDLTEDGRVDLLYISANGDQSLALREQLADGGFGPERRFVFERPVRSVKALPRGTAGALSFCAVDSRSGGVEFFRLQQGQAVIDGSGFSAAQPEVYPILKKGRASARYAFGDVDGDGQEDLLVANASAAELGLFLKQGRGFGTAQRFPSFSEISSMTCGHFFDDARDKIVLISAAEKTVGVSHLNERGRIVFPRQLPMGEGKPLVCQAVDLDADGYDELAVVSEAKGGMTLTLLRPADRGASVGEWTVLARTLLHGVKRKPSAIRMLDIFADGRRGLMVFVPREAPVLLVADPTDAFEFAELGKHSTIRESLLKGVQPSQLSVFDVDADGVNELVVGRTGYARALRVRAGELEMVDQFNARRGDELVSAVVPVYAQGALAQVAFYVESAGEFQFLEPDADGVFRYRMTQTAGKIKLSQWRRLTGRSAQAEYIFAGADCFWRLPASSDVWTREVIDRYETALKDVQYSYLECADFDRDGRADLVAIDGKNHVAEILVQNQSNWGSRMFWQVFEQNLHYQGRTGGRVEPREVLVADLTGDGKLDLALLVHDRVLIYPQR